MINNHFTDHYTMDAKKCLLHASIIISRMQAEKQLPEGYQEGKEGYKGCIYELVYLNMKKIVKFIKFYQMIREVIKNIIDKAMIAAYMP